MIATRILSGLLLIGCLCGHATAETIRIPVGQQGHQEAMEKPSLGMTKTEVRERFGEPTSLRDPRGEPPISRWEYERFVVYFESDTVIHSVIKHVRQDSESSVDP